MRTGTRRICGCGIAVMALAGCHTTASITQPPTQPLTAPITTLAVTPTSGAFGNAAAEELAEGGMRITFTDESRMLLISLHLSDSSMAEPATLARLHQNGIAAVLSLVAWYETNDFNPDSAKARVIDTGTGHDVAAVDWSNGRGNQGTMQNTTMRSSASAAALMIGKALRKQLEPTTDAPK